nr:hypothetical protein [Tanacetum cinerariifolium]
KDSPFDLEAYFDSDYAGASLDRESTTGDKTVYKEWEDRMERATTTASRLEAERDSGNINRTQSMATLNEPLPYGTGLGSGPRSKIAQAKKIANLKKRVKKLEKRRKSRPTGLRRLKKGRMHDADMFGVDDLEGNEVFIDVREKIVKKEVSIADPVTTAGEVVTDASVEDSVAPTTATTADDKGKEKMIKPEKPLKKKDQIALDEEVARRLEVEMKSEMEEEERIAREKDEANRAVIEEQDDVQATIDADRQLAKKFKLKKENSYPLKKDLNFWLSLLNLGEKNVEESLKKIQAEGSSKRARQELEQEKIVPKDDDDVAIEATPLSSKSPTTVDYKIYREGKNSYFKIIRADGNSQNYLSFGTMFKNFNREDLEVLRSIIKKRFKKTEPLDDMDTLLFQTLKTMFEPHVKDIIWKYQQGAIKVNNWKLFDSCGVYCVTTKTMVYYLLVEKMYPFTNSILHQLWGEKMDRSTGPDRKTGPRSKVLYQFGLRSGRSGPVRSYQKPEDYVV